MSDSHVASPSDVTGTLSITDVAHLTARMQATNRALFERLGGWITTTSPPELQRLFAMACHRHTWHAELWEQRRPTIPVEIEIDPVTIADVDDAEVRRRIYAAKLDELAGELADVATRVEPELDPSTARVLDLVEADLVRLRRLVA